MKHIPQDLKPGEWQLYCPQCGFKHEKNAAARPICPDCGTRMQVAKEHDTQE